MFNLLYKGGTSLKIQLRSYQPNDLNSLVILANNPNIQANLNDSFPYPYTYQDAYNCLKLTNNTNLPIIELAIIYNQQFCGAISLTFGQDLYSHIGEIGYWIGQPYWNKGIATKALQMMIDNIFKNYDLKIIVARVFSNNLASKKVLTKNHFKHLITLNNYAFKRGNFLDVDLFELTIDQYQLSLKNNRI